VGREHGVTPSLDETEHVVMRDFLTKPNAARAENAALVIERDTRAELHIFWLLYFVFEKA
jgi:hypothetical protein